MLRAWLITYAFVGIQMGYLLRPFVGNPDQPVSFFREEAWGNAYVTVAKLIWSVLSGNCMGSATGSPSTQRKRSAWCFSVSSVTLWPIRFSISSRLGDFAGCSSGSLPIPRAADKTPA
jgi:hypothetical protein